mmetsp:Transcript_658/g.1103  ORF Transcript_658/g.1103 Transcript_658/m.1103 type:complete len:169 (+) Transcript_658:80-586(+)
MVVRRVGNCYVVDNYGPVSFSVSSNIAGVFVTYTVLLSGTLFVYNLGNKIGSIYVWLTFAYALTTAALLLLLAVLDPGIIIYSSAVSNDYANCSFSSYCDVCGISQPQLAAHCVLCDCCVEEYHHHCPWLGKCIGRKNKRIFFLFNCVWITYVFYGIFIISASVYVGN